MSAFLARSNVSQEYRDPGKGGERIGDHRNYTKEEIMTINANGAATDNTERAPIKWTF
jgi:hypothetical protein